MSEKIEIINLVLVDLAESATKLAQSAIGQCHITRIPYDVEKLMETIDPMPMVIICGKVPAELSAIEIAQMLRMQYTEHPIFLVVPAGVPIDRKDLIKNGFTDVFFEPVDNMTFTKVLYELGQKIRNNGRVYRSVKIMDLEPDQPLDFSTFLYLSVNKKHIKMSNAGDPVSADRVEKLKKHQMGSLFVPQDEMQKFYQYSAQKLKLLGDNTAISETERSEKLQSSVRNLISDLFSDVATSTEQGKKVVEDCKHIVKNYISGTPSGKWYDRILAISAQSTDTYSHASNVSTYAALFAISLGMKNVEDISLAGLLHDIGLAKVKPEILSRPESEWFDEEKVDYQKHCDYSLQMIKDRKLIVPEIVPKIIAQHHEKFNGTGYPKGLAGTRILKEAQILGIADMFDELTVSLPGKPQLTPSGAIKKLQLENAQKLWFDPQLLCEIMKIFPEDVVVDTSTPSSPPAAAG